MSRQLSSQLSSTMPATLDRPQAFAPLPHPYHWALARRGIYFRAVQSQARRQEYTIQYVDLESGQVAEVFRKEGPFQPDWLAVSPDEEWILFSETPTSTSELMLVENFR